MPHLYCFSQSYPSPSPTWCCPYQVAHHQLSQNMTLILAILPPRVHGYICHFYSLSIACIHSSFIPSASIWDLISG